MKHSLIILLLFLCGCSDNPKKSNKPLAKGPVKKMYMVIKTGEFLYKKPNGDRIQSCLVHRGETIISKNFFIVTNQQQRAKWIQDIRTGLWVQSAMVALHPSKLLEKEIDSIGACFFPINGNRIAEHKNNSIDNIIIQLARSNDCFIFDRKGFFMHLPPKAENSFYSQGAIISIQRTTTSLKIHCLGINSYPKIYYPNFSGLTTLNTSSNFRSFFSLNERIYFDLEFFFTKNGLRYRGKEYFRYK